MNGSEVVDPAFCFENVEDAISLAHTVKAIAKQSTAMSAYKIPIAKSCIGLGGEMTKGLRCFVLRQMNMLSLRRIS